MKHLNIIFLALSVLLIGACSNELLNTNLLDKQTEGNFYKTKNDAYKALVGCYDGLQQVYDNGVAFPIASEVLSDNCYGGTGNSDGFGYQMLDEFNKDKSPSDLNLFQDNWIAYYKALFRCNMLISKMDQIDWAGDRTLRNNYEGEVRFIRAYCYFDMVRLWGSVPLLVAPSADIIPQTNPDDLYKIIAEDLKFAADSMTSLSYPNIPTAEYGRITKWAAEALLARVYLFYTGYYSKTDLGGIVTKTQALNYLEDVITHGGFGLVSNYANLWPAASLRNYVGEDNKETVFAIKYTYTSDYNGNTDGNHWMVMNGLREQSAYPYGLGWGACTVNPKLWNAYDANDTRKVASVISIADEEIDFQKVDKQREYTGYYTKKYTPMCDSLGNSLAVKLGGTNFMIGQYQDFVAIRYADVLLMAAELGSSNAQSYFDQVRQRAFGTNFTQITVSKSAIMDERRLEFAFEGLRYWDLLRQGLTVTAAAINETTTVKNGGKSESLTITFNAITKGLQQIPYNQITLSNNVYVQNPGW